MSVLRLPFKSNRKFILYRYYASHGTIVLRSAKSKDFPTRLEIMIKAVAYMEIKSYFSGIIIEQLDSIESLEHLKFEPGLSAYRISDGQWRGYIVGTSFSFAEDSKEFGGRSDFIDSALPQR